MSTPSEMVDQMADVSEKPDVVDEVQTPEAEAVEAAPEATPEVVAETKEPEEKQRVPLAELIEERKRAREAERQLREFQNVLLQAQIKRQEQEAKAAEPEKTKIKFDDSPIDYLKQEVDEAKQTAAQLRAERDAQAQQAQQSQTQQAQLRQFTELVRADEAKFVEKNPDYYDALMFVREITKASLEEYELTPEQMDQQMRQSEFQQSLAAMQRNKSPAQTVYKIAQKLGYKKLENAVPAAKTGDTELQKRKQAAARNPTSSGLPSVDDLAEMPASDFDTAFSAAFGKK